jgi:hypothetical protein
VLGNTAAGLMRGPALAAHLQSRPNVHIIIAVYRKTMMETHINASNYTQGPPQLTETFRNLQEPSLQISFSNCFGMALWSSWPSFLPLSSSPLLASPVAGAQKPSETSRNLRFKFHFQIVLGWPCGPLGPPSSPSPHPLSSPRL